MSPHTKKLYHSIFAIFLAVCVCWVNVVEDSYANNQEDIDVSLSITPRASYFFDELYEILVEKTSLYEIGIITLVNNTNEEKTVKLRVRLYSELLGPSPVVDYTTQYASFPIDIPTNGVVTLTNTEISDDMLEGGTLRTSQSDIEDRIRDVYGNNILVETSGMLPEDTYTYKIDVFDKDADELNMGNALAQTVEESLFIPLEYGNIDIIYPEHETVLSSANPSPIFYWTPLNVRDNVNVIYTVSIWKADNDAIESVIETAPIVEESTDKTQFSYPSFAEPLEKSMSYVWRVTALDEENYKIGITSASSPSMFKYGYIEAPQLLESSLEFDAFPIQLGWVAEDMTVPMQIVISELPDGTNPILIETVNTNMFQLSESSLLKYNKAYYWYVHIGEGENAVRSDIGVFRIHHTIELIYPDNDVISGDSLSLFWKGDSGLSYSVLIAENPELDHPLTFNVDGTQLHLDSNDLKLKPNVNYFWKVQQLPLLSSYTSKTDAVGTFTLEALELPELLAPKGKINEQDITFLFQQVNWADTYRLDILDTRNQVVLSEETKNPQVIINRQSLRKVVPDTQFLWRVAAFNQQGDPPLYSPSIECELVADDSQIDINQSFVLRYPNNQTLESKTLIFQWDLIEAQRYQLLIDTTDQFLSPLTAHTTDSFYSITLDKEGTYYWKVFALDNQGNTLKVSNIEQFTVKGSLKGISAQRLEEMSYFIKDQLDQSSALKEESWGLSKIQSLDGRPITESDISYLITNKQALIEVVE